MLFRTSMNNEENKDMIQSLLQLGFSKDKIIIHSDTTLLEELNLKRIHLKVIIIICESFLTVIGQVHI